MPQSESFFYLVGWGLGGFDCFSLHLAKLVIFFSGVVIFKNNRKLFLPSQYIMCLYIVMTEQLTMFCTENDLGGPVSPFFRFLGPFYVSRDEHFAVKCCEKIQDEDSH